MKMWSLGTLCVNCEVCVVSIEYTIIAHKDYLFKSHLQEYKSAKFCLSQKKYSIIDSLEGNYVARNLLTQRSLQNQNLLKISFWYGKEEFTILDMSYYKYSILVYLLRTIYCNCQSQQQPRIQSIENTMSQEITQSSISSISLISNFPPTFRILQLSAQNVKMTMISSTIHFCQQNIQKIGKYLSTKDFKVVIAIVPKKRSWKNCYLIRG